MKKALVNMPFNRSLQVEVITSHDNNFLLGVVPSPFHSGLSQMGWGARGWPALFPNDLGEKKGHFLTQLAGGHGSHVATQHGEWATPSDRLFRPQNERVAAKNSRFFQIQVLGCLP